MTRSRGAQSKNKPLTIAEKVHLLFERGKEIGLPTTYRAIAEATGENANNLRKIHRGLNANPGIRTVEAICRYFQVSVAFFECQTMQDCTDFLQGIEHAEREQVAALRASDLSLAGLKAVEDMIEHIRAIERAAKEKHENE